MILKTEAIVLKTYDFRETSKIALFFSREFGKIKGLLKGIRTDYKKFNSPLNTFSLNEIVFYKKINSELNLISQCDLREDFPGIRQNLKKTFVSSYILEIVESMMQLEDKNIAIFNLLLTSLKSISKEIMPDKILYFFLIKMLSLSGFKPHFDSCIVCEKRIHNIANFSQRLGGLLCYNCRRKDINSSPILKGTIATIIHVEKYPWELALKLGLSQRIRSELDNLLNNFILYHLERPLKSIRYLELQNVS